MLITLKTLQQQTFKVEIDPTEIVSTSSAVVMYVSVRPLLLAVCQPADTGEDMGQFSASPINKAVPSFTNSSTRLCER